MKHKVVVDKSMLDSYLEKGYVHSDTLLSEQLGHAWYALSKDERDALVLLEIDQDEHRAQNAPPRVFVVHQSCQFVVTRAELLKLDVLERSDNNTLCANADFDSGPRWFVTADLGDDARQAVAIARPSILEAIAEHRRIADELTSFLQGMEAL